MATLVLEDLNLVWLNDLLKRLPPEVKVGTVTELTQGRAFFTQGDADKIEKACVATLPKLYDTIREMCLHSLGVAGAQVDIDFERAFLVNLFDLPAFSIHIKLSYPDNLQIVVYNTKGEVTNADILEDVHWSKRWAILDVVKQGLAGKQQS